MFRKVISAAALLSCLAPAVRAQPASPPASAASASATWRPIYQNGQVVYYVDTRPVAASGPADVASLLEYKIPQVVNGAQVWSIVSHMQVNCDADLMITTDNTLYAMKMGGGPVVAEQPANDSWHRPQPDSLGDLIWKSACRKPSD